MLTDIVTKRFHNHKRFFFLKNRIKNYYKLIAKHVEIFPRKEKDLIFSNEILQMKGFFKKNRIKNYCKLITKHVETFPRKEKDLIFSNEILQMKK